MQQTFPIVVTSNNLIRYMGVINMRFLKVWGLCLISSIILFSVSSCSAHHPTDLTDPNLIDQSDIKTVKIQDNSPAAILWSPKNIQLTKSKVFSLLQSAKKTNITIPEQPKVIFYAYMGPVKLQITENNGGEVNIYPASYLAKWKLDENGNQMYHMVYIDNSITFAKNGSITYYNDPMLYDWLKNNQWQLTFTDIIS
jgi:hypothetical protein